MSKEMAVIGLGAFLLIQTQFGIPDSWHGAFVVLSGFAIILLGFFLRTEALARDSGQASGRSAHQTFVEHMPKQPMPSMTSPTLDPLGHEQKDGINSLN